MYALPFVKQSQRTKLNLLRVLPLTAPIRRAVKKKVYNDVASESKSLSNYLQRKIMPFDMNCTIAQLNTLLKSTSSRCEKGPYSSASPSPICPLSIQRIL